MPSWLPGDDYMTDFKVGDPYVRVDDGYARLPGAGYEALHPELEGVNPEDYPDIHKLRILSDVAPYSREYNTFRQKVASEARYDTETQIELDKIIDRVRQVKESSIRMDERRFTAPVEEIAGTVETRVFRPAGQQKPRARAAGIGRLPRALPLCATLSSTLVDQRCGDTLPSRRPTKTSRARASGGSSQSLHNAPQHTAVPKMGPFGTFSRGPRFRPHIAV
jgi:hypothetical protein